MIHDFVNDIVVLALESYLGLAGPAREKRAWLTGIGELSHDLFGIALQRDVDELRNRYNQLPEGNPVKVLCFYVY